MNGGEMSFSDNNFDVIAIYNAVKHLEDILAGIVQDCYGVVPSG
jgi:hypothetical protein